MKKEQDVLLDRRIFLTAAAQTGVMKASSMPLRVGAARMVILQRPDMLSHVNERENL